MMIRTLTGAVLALGLGLPAAAADAPAAPAAATPAAKPGPSDRAQIAALEKAFAAAVETKDAGKVMAFYAKKGLFVFDVVPPRAYPSWDAYKKDWEGLFAEAKGPVKIDISDLAIEVSGAMAYSHSIQVLSYEGKTGPTAPVVRVSDVYRKDGGKWRIVHEHVSVPVDLDTGKADLQSKP